MSEDWIKALRFAALPGAAKVRLECRHLIEDGTPTTKYKLQSETDSGSVIGDPRDYDLLKAVMTPLETLCEAEAQTDFIVELDLKNNALTGLSKPKNS